MRGNNPQQNIYIRVTGYRPNQFSSFFLESYIEIKARLFRFIKYIFFFEYKFYFWEEHESFFKNYVFLNTFR